MAQEHLEVVRVAYDAFARDELDRFMQHFTDSREGALKAAGLSY